MKKRKSDPKTLVPKGFLKVYTLKLLKQKPLCGYEIMKEIQNKTGFWKPSSGTIYPLINSLKKEGLIKKLKTEKRKNLYKLTKKGERNIEKLEDVKEELRKKFLDVFSNLLNIERKELERISKKIKKNKLENSSLKLYIHETHLLILEALDNQKNFTKIEKILKDTNTKLKRLI